MLHTTQHILYQHWVNPDKLFVCSQYRPAARVGFLFDAGGSKALCGAVAFDRQLRPGDDEHGCDVQTDLGQEL